MVQQLSQVGSRLRLARIRPQNECEVLALLRCVPAKKEIGEKGLQPGGLECPQSLGPPTDIQAAQQADPQEWRLSCPSEGFLPTIDDLPAFHETTLGIRTAFHKRGSSAAPIRCWRSAASSGPRPSRVPEGSLPGGFS